MTTRSRAVVLGSLYLIGSQVLMGVVQFVYSGFTGRVLEPQVFGAYAVALSATGLLPLLFSTGLSSFVLAADDLNTSATQATMRLAWLSGCLGAIALIVGAPAWSWAWHAPAATTFSRILALQVLLAAPAAVSLARVRRAGNARADAFIQAVATVTGLALGVLSLYVTGDPLSLTVAPIVGAAMNLLMAQRVARPSSIHGPFQSKDVLAWTWRISRQNTFFFLLLSLPAWAVSVGTNPFLLGQFSRASLLTGLAATALSTALVRALSPFYREARMGDLKGAVTDAATVVGGIAMPSFLLLAIIGGRIIDIWLGPGWHEAARIVPLLALGYGVNVVFTVLANAAEMLGQFREVKYAQFAMALVGIALAALLVVSGKLLVGASLILAMSSVGIVVLLVGLRGGPTIDASRLVKSLGVQAAWSLWVAVAAGVALRLGSHFELSNVTSILLTGCVGMFAWAATLRWQPSWMILRERRVVSFSKAGE